MHAPSLGTPCSGGRCRRQARRRDRLSPQPKAAPKEKRRTHRFGHFLTQAAPDDLLTSICGGLDIAESLGELKMSTKNTLMAEALKPLLPLIRKERTRVEPVSQLHLTLRGDDLSAVFRTARREILDYAKNRASGSLPARALKGESFTTDEVGPRRVEGVSIKKPRYWALRFDDDDRRVAGRSWVIEAALARDEEGESVLFGLRLQCVARRKNPAYVRSMPTFARSVIKACDARLDNRRVSMSPWLVDTDDKADDLVDFLFQRDRTADVVVVSLPGNSIDTSRGLISARELAKHLAGVAHVAVISKKASYRLSDRIGKEFSVFDKGVRTYRSGFDPDQQSISMHPLWTALRIKRWKGGPEEYKNFLISETLKRSVDGSRPQKRVPTFSEAKRVEAEISRKKAKDKGAGDREFLKLYEKENQELTNQINKMEEENEEYINILQEDLKNEKDEKERLKDVVHELQNKIQSLEKLKSVKEGTPIPSSLDELKEWAARELVGSVELHNRALRGAKHSVFDDVSLIYKALLLLRDYYVPMKRDGGQKLKKEFTKRCAELGIQEQKTFSGTRAGERGDEYVIRDGNRRIELDRHLKKGTNREPRHCFRLYFHWDTERRQVIVGWLPSHLTTRAS